MPAIQEESRPVGDLHVAFVADKGVVKERSQWWGSAVRARWDAATTSLFEGVDAAICAWTADQRNKKLGQEPTADERRPHGAPVRAAKDRELGAWGGFTVFEPVWIREPSKAIADSRWVLT